MPIEEPAPAAGTAPAAAPAGEPERQALSVTQLAEALIAGRFRARVKEVRRLAQAVLDADARKQARKARKALKAAKGSKAERKKDKASGKRKLSRIPAQQALS